MTHLLDVLEDVMAMRKAECRIGLYPSYDERDEFIESTTNRTARSSSFYCHEPVVWGSTPDRGRLYFVRLGLEPAGRLAVVIGAIDRPDEATRL